MIRNKYADQWNDFLKLPFFRQRKSESTTIIDIVTLETATATKDTTTKQVKLCTRNVNKKLRR